MKRLWWLAAGFGLGIVASRRVRRRSATAAGEVPGRGGGGWARAHVHEAIEEGRREARRREVALRAVLAAPRNGARDPER